MGRRLKSGSAVAIRDGETMNDADETVDVAGMTGTVSDDVGYENLRTGELMVGVDLDGEHGGGKVFVPDRRLGSPRSVGWSRAVSRNWDRIFGAKST